MLGGRQDGGRHFGAPGLGGGAQGAWGSEGCPGKPHRLRERAAA